MFSLVIILILALVLMILALIYRFERQERREYIKKYVTAKYEQEILDTKYSELKLLLEELEGKYSTINSQNLELSKNLNDSNDSIVKLKNKITHMKNRIVCIKKVYEEEYSVEKMEELSEFEVEKDNNGEGILYMGYCQLNGCNLDEIKYPSYEEALKKATLLTLEGKKPHGNTSCIPCYNEYIAEYVL